jgi:hypothetical protein
VQRPLGRFQVNNNNKKTKPSQIISKTHVPAATTRSLGQLATSNQLQNEYGTIMWNTGYILLLKVRRRRKKAKKGASL